MHKNSHYKCQIHVTPLCLSSSGTILMYVSIFTDTFLSKLKNSKYPVAFRRGTLFNFYIKFTFLIVEDMTSMYVLLSMMLVFSLYINYMNLTRERPYLV